jgi:hypothetical protein
VFASLPMQMFLEWIVVRRCFVSISSWLVLAAAGETEWLGRAGTPHLSGGLATEQRNTPYVGFWTCPVYGIPFEIGWNASWQNRLYVIHYGY